MSKGGDSTSKTSTSTNTVTKDNRIISDGTGNIALSDASKLTQNISFDKNVAGLVDNALIGSGNLINDALDNMIHFGSKALDVASKANSDAIDKAISGTQKLATNLTDSQTKVTDKVLTTSIAENKALLSRIAPYVVVAGLGGALIFTLPKILSKGKK